MIGQTSLASLPTLRSYESKRISSWDTTGANTDAWRIKAGEKRVIGQIEGPGCIKHIWMTLGLPAEDYCRRIVLRMYWDGSADPSVECPIGDFFGLGHGMRKDFTHRPAPDEPAGRQGIQLLVAHAIQGKGRVWKWKTRARKAISNTFT